MNHLGLPETGGFLGVQPFKGYNPKVLGKLGQVGHPRCQGYGPPGGLGA